MSETRPATSQQQGRRAACDRCRGQKLRCVYDDTTQSICQRCQRAGVTCYHSASLPMGRRPTRKRPNSSENHRAMRPQSPHHSLPNSPVAPSPSYGHLSSEIASNISTSRYGDLDPLFPVGLINNTSQSCTTSPNKSTDSALGDMTSVTSPVNLASNVLQSPIPDTFFVGLSSHQILDLDIPLDADETMHAENSTVMNALQPGHESRRHETLDELFIGEFNDVNTSNPIDNRDLLPTCPDASPAASSHTPIQQLVSLNFYMQRLIRVSDEGKNWGLKNHQPLNSGEEGNSPTGSRLIDEFLRSIQTLLDIVQLFQPKQLKYCSSCDGRYQDFESAGNHSDHYWPNTETILSIISCYVQLLRLCTDFFYYVSMMMKTGSISNCVNLSYLSILPAHGLPFRATADLQVSILTYTVIRMLHSLERVLGSNLVFSPNLGFGNATEQIRECPDGQVHQQDCNHEDSAFEMASESKMLRNNYGLLARCRSLELLEAAVRLEDMHSQKNGKRSIKDLRQDIARVRATL
ncbi:hypothetical protein CC78DRAFT_565157 [Lojkania enalia]|uniref:Zn(2)-C6 fungal-type domain-containing protein n=1 Tax=Lojkania enalia TaxID=147567 RepID=A0A9P4N782_9PLEO|nr:hypothetical protein CC78DRAFT_565157 [Didymosphaeria enalia]